MVSQVSIVRPDSNTTRSAFYLLYPSTLTNVTETLGIKGTITSTKKSLVLAMLQKSIPSEFPDVSSIRHYPADWVDSLRKLVGDNLRYQRAARYFKFPPDLLETLQQCPFSVFNEISRYHPLGALNGSDGEKPVEDIETIELVELLTRKRPLPPPGLQAHRLDWRERHPFPAGIMLVHADSWPREGEDVPEFMGMRDLDIMFFRYGSPSVKKGLYRGEDAPVIHQVFPFSEFWARYRANKS